MPLKRLPRKDSPWDIGGVESAAFVIGAEIANVINVGISLKDPDAVKKAASQGVLAYLSSNADGSTVVATAPTTVAIGTDGLAIPLVAGKCFLLVSESDGDIDLNITLSSGAATYYLVIVLPDGRLAISTAITFAA